MTPLVSDWAARAAINVNEKSTMEVNSAGPNLSAIAAKGAASRMRTISEKVSPKTEE